MNGVGVEPAFKYRLSCVTCLLAALALGAGTSVALIYPITFAQNLEGGAIHSGIATLSAGRSIGLHGCVWHLAC